MKKVFLMLMVIGLAVGIQSCGGGSSLEKYYVTVEGEDAVAQGASCGFMGDGISGLANFTFDDKSGSIELLDCWNKQGENGIADLEGQTFDANVTLGEKTISGLKATINKVTREESSMGGADYEITGTLDGEAKGKFNVSAFSMK